MISFKEQVEKDNGGTFLNLSEFGEEHRLNDTLCTCILQGDTIQQALSIGDGTCGDRFQHERSDRAIYGADLTVNVKASDLEEETPVYGQLFTVDEEIYIVQSVKEDMGMLTIGLVANER